MDENSRDDLDLMLGFMIHEGRMRISSYLVTREAVEE
jgi:hypothetical protein